MNPGLLQKLENRVAYSEQSKIKKLFNRPIHSVYSYLLSNFSRGLKKTTRVKTKTFWGDSMTVILPEFVSTRIFRYEFYEEGLTRMVLEYLKPGMIFIDVGAHFGYYTMMANKLVGNKGQVHSFEPTPRTYEVLLNNVTGRHNVVCNHLAALEVRKTFFLNDYGLEFSAFNSFYGARTNHKHAQNGASKIPIEAISLDEYFQNKKIIPDFVKIDAESSEYEVLQGMEKTILNFRPMISLEVGDCQVTGAMASRDLVRHLLDKGYEAYEYRDKKIMPHKVKSQYAYANILFI